MIKKFLALGSLLFSIFWGKKVKRLASLLALQINNICYNSVEGFWLLSFD